MDEVRPMVGVSMLRLGRNYDGGYVVPKLALIECDALISLGYGYDSSFEREFLKFDRKKSVALYDLNINLKSSIKRLFLDLFSVIFQGRGFPVFRGKQLLEYLLVLFNQRINYKIGKIGHVNDSKCLNLVDTSKAIAGKNIILKMDIEGSEYESLDLDLHYLGRFQCLIIEFHDIASRSDEFLSITNSIKKEFTLMNTHINNFAPIVKGIPQVVELCFIRSSLIAKDSLKWADSIPNPIDLPCNPSKPEIIYQY
jgi:hypothetical protein